MNMMTEPALLRLDEARRVLLDPYQIDETALQRALAKVFEHRLDFADVYLQYTRSEGWSLEEGLVKSGSFDIEQGFGIRAVQGEKTAFAYSDDISELALLEAADTVRSIARAGQGSAKVPADTRRSAGIQHAQGLRQIQPLQHQGRRLLGSSVLHRHPAVSKPRQHLHRHGLCQLQALRPHHLCF